MRSGVIRLGIDWGRSPDLIAAWTPVLDRVDALQLTVEQAFARELPEAWTVPLDVCSFRVGHALQGVPWTQRRTRLEQLWLEKTRRVLTRWPVRWLIDHVGCSRAGGWDAAPIPLPGSRALVAMASENLRWMADGLEVPVGLENLALAASADDAKLQADVVGAVLEAVDGVLLLDLHNLWCQAANYDLDPIELLERWPLERVVQVHVAGGSWMEHPAGRLRRDTHDGAVPDEVFALVPAVLARCPRLEVVVLERLGEAAGGPADAALGETLRAELERLRSLLVPVDTLPRRPHPPLNWRHEPPAVQDLLFRALEHDDRAALEAFAPGWWTDDRSWRAAVGLLKRWGRRLPQMPA